MKRSIKDKLKGMAYTIGVSVFLLLAIGVVAQVTNNNGNWTITGTELAKIQGGNLTVILLDIGNNTYAEVVIAKEGLWKGQGAMLADYNHDKFLSNMQSLNKCGTDANFTTCNTLINRANNEVYTTWEKRVKEYKKLSQWNKTKDMTPDTIS